MGRSSSGQDAVNFGLRPLLGNEPLTIVNAFHAGNAGSNPARLPKSSRSSRVNYLLCKTPLERPLLDLFLSARHILQGVPDHGLRHAKAPG